MAISSGAGPHRAWLNVGGASFPVEHGQVNQSAERKTSSFNCVIPLSYPGARAFFASATAGMDVSITVLARGETATLFTGEMDNVRFNYIPQREIQVTGRDKSYKLHEKITSEKWLNKKPSEIVEDLIGRVGLSGNVAASIVKAGKQLQQDFVKLSENNSFGRIIHEMARIDGARWWIDQNGTFNYALYGTPNGSYSVSIEQDAEPIRSDCLQLEISHNLQAGRPQEVTVKGWHPKKRDIIQGTSNISGSGPSRTWNYQVPTLTQDRADRHAKSEATEKARHEFQVTASVVGDPSVHAGMGLQVSGTDFDGTYDIDTVDHDFGMSGYLSRITARGPGSGRSAS